MTKRIINIGTTANDRSGDAIRTAFQKVNDNFTELYAGLPQLSVGPTPPEGPHTNGEQWWDSTDGNSYIWFDNTWVPSTASVADQAKNVRQNSGNSINIDFQTDGIITTTLDSDITVAFSNYTQGARVRVIVSTDSSTRYVTLGVPAGQSSNGATIAQASTIPSLIVLDYICAGDSISGVYVTVDDSAGGIAPSGGLPSYLDINRTVVSGNKVILKATDNTVDSFYIGGTDQFLAIDKFGAVILQARVDSQMPVILQGAISTLVNTANPITDVVLEIPIIITVANSGLNNNDKVYIEGFTSCTELNGNSYYVNQVSSDQYELYLDRDLQVSTDGLAFSAFVGPDTGTITSAPEGGDIYINAGANNVGVNVGDSGSIITYGRNITTTADGTITLTAGINALTVDATTGLLYNGSPISGGGGTPAGNTGEIQLNNNGAFGSDSTLRYVDNNSEMTLYADYVSTGGVFTDIISGDGSNVSLWAQYGKNWTFDTDGNLTLPGDINFKYGGAIWEGGHGQGGRGWQTGLNIVGALDNSVSTPIRIYLHGGDGKGLGAGAINVKNDRVEIYGNFQNDGHDGTFWTFAHDASTTFPNGSKLDGGTSYKFATDNSVTQYIDLRDTSGRGFYTDGSGYTLRTSSSHSWIFDPNGILNLPNSTTGAPLIQATNEIQLNADGSTFTFGSDGNLYVPNEIRSTAGVGPVTIEANDGTLRTWTFGGDGNTTLPGGLVIGNTEDRLTLNSNFEIGAYSNNTRLQPTQRDATVEIATLATGNMDPSIWTFGADGVLRMPDGNLGSDGRIDFNFEGYNWGRISSHNRQVYIHSVEDNGENLPTYGKGAVLTELAVGLDVAIVTNTQDVAPNNWIFGIDGATTVPAPGAVTFGPIASTVGTGNGGTFHVTIANGAYSVTADYNGTGYSGVTDPMTVPGDQLGGVTPDNDLTVTFRNTVNGGWFNSVESFSGTPATINWKFNTNNKLQLPPGGDIVDSEGETVLGFAASYYSGYTVLASFQDGHITVTGDVTTVFGSGQVIKFSTLTEDEYTVGVVAYDDINDWTTITLVEGLGGPVDGDPILFEKYNISEIYPGEGIQSTLMNNVLTLSALPQRLINNGHQVTLDENGILTVPGDIRGHEVIDSFDHVTVVGHTLSIAPAPDAPTKKFTFRIDQFGEPYTRAYLDMPQAENNHQVGLTFPHDNGTCGFIYTQGANTYDDGMNNAFNLFYNHGDIKITAEDSVGGLSTWRFGNDGILTLPTIGAQIASDVTFTGSVTFQNPVTYTQSTNTVYTDSLIEIHAPATGVDDPWTVNDGNDIGFKFHYYNGADKNAGLFLDNGTWRLKFVADGTETNGQFTHSGLGDIEAANFYGALKGNADTVTNGVVTTGSYSNPTWITSLAYSKLTGTPNLGIYATSSQVTTLQNSVNVLNISVGSLTNGIVTTVAKTGLPLAQLGQARVLTLTPSPSNNGSWGSAGLSEQFDITISGTTVSVKLNVDEGGNITVNVISSTNGSVSVGDSTTITGQHGGNDYDTNPVNVTVASVSGPTAIDLTKVVNELTDGAYTLADGSEGQVLNLTTQATVTSAATIQVTVSNFRTTGSASTNYTLYPFVNSSGTCRLIFNNGSWQSSNLPSTITANLTGNVSGSSGSTSGNAATATKLAATKNINGVAFDGSANITVAAAAGTLTGGTLASNVLASSLTSVGTLTSLTVSGAITRSGAISTAGWGATGVVLKLGAATFTDNSSTGTVASQYINSMGTPTFASTNTTVITDAANLFIAAPATGPNVTITNGYSLISQGNVRIDGNLYMPNRPAFRVVGTGGQIASVTTITGSNWTQDFQQGSALNGTTGIFTAPLAGLYQVNLVVRAYTNSGVSAQVICRKTTAVGSVVTTAIMVEWAANTTMNHTGGSTIIKLAVGDTLKVDVTVGSISFDANDNWSVAFIG